MEEQPLSQDTNNTITNTTSITMPTLRRPFESNLYSSQQSIIGILEALRPVTQRRNTNRKQRRRMGYLLTAVTNQINDLVNDSFDFAGECYDELDEYQEELIECYTEIEEYKKEIELLEAQLKEMEKRVVSN
jgi:chromosome segregation ATPase